MRLSLKANITADEAKHLDKLLHAAGFLNRTDYLTALLHETIYGEPGQSPLPPSLNHWIAAVRDIAATRDTVTTAILDAYQEMVFPVIAMRGGKEAIVLLRQEIEAAVLDTCDVLPGAEDLELCMRIFQNTRRPELSRHRTEQLAAAFRQNNQTEEKP